MVVDANMHDLQGSAGVLPVFTLCSAAASVMLSSRCLRVAVLCGSCSQPYLDLHGAGLTCDRIHKSKRINLLRTVPW
eukprot:182969-Alexandrium_andersonii.AAC.1